MVRGRGASHCRGNRAQVAAAGCREKQKRISSAHSTVARKQQAKSWELRAAMSIARLWRDQGKGQEARELLGSGLRVVHRGVRHARSEGGEGAAG